MKESKTGLWKQHDFLKLWLSQTTSQFGSQIVLLGIPLLAAYTLQATPTQMGVLRAVEYVPFRFPLKQSETGKKRTELGLYTCEFIIQKEKPGASTGQISLQK